MNYTDWKLTSEEEEKCRLKGISLGKAQMAKKSAYKLAGGVILNPDALTDLYGALKVVVDYFNSPEIANASEFIPQLRKALAKAEGKE